MKLPNTDEVKIPDFAEIEVSKLDSRYKDRGKCIGRTGVLYRISALKIPSYYRGRKRIISAALLLKLDALDVWRSANPGGTIADFSREYAQSASDNVSQPASQSTADKFTDRLTSSKTNAVSTDLPRNSLPLSASGRQTDKLTDRLENDSSSSKIKQLERKLAEKDKVIQKLKKENRKLTELNQHNYYHAEQRLEEIGVLVERLKNLSKHSQEMEAAVSYLHGKLMKTMLCLEERET